MNVSHFHYAHRESARMIVNLREWRSSLFKSDECISLSLDASWVCENDRESARMTINSWLFCSECQSINRDERLKLYQYVNSRFSLSSLRHFNQLSIFLFVEINQHSINSRSFCLSIFDIHLMISTIFTFLSVETSLVKKKNRSHTHLKSSIFNKSTLKTSNKKFDFDFASFVSISLFQRFQWVRYND